MKPVRNKKLSVSQVAVSVDVADIAALTADSSEKSYHAIKAAWFLGAWQKLVAEDPELYKEHEYEARILAFISSAHYQLGNAEIGLVLANKSIATGIGYDTLSAIMISSIHNSIAKVYSLIGEEDVAKHHFHDSMAIDGIKADDFLLDTRILSELAYLNLIQSSKAYISKKIDNLADEDSGQLSAAVKFLRAELKKLDDVAVRSSASDLVLQKRVITQSDYNNSIKILVAGMRHSGSTALFNIIRIALAKANIDFDGFYSDGKQAELLTQSDKNVLLVKTHELRDDVAENADLVITTVRDLRDTVASAKRRNFPNLARMGVREYAKYNRALHDLWQQYSDYEFNYERYKATPVLEINTILKILGLDFIDGAEIHLEVNSLPVDKYEVTLLSPLHITDPEGKLKFNDTLLADDITNINKDNFKWLNQHGYE